MCNFKSYIVGPKKIYEYEGVDSHEEIIKKARLKDGIGGGNFVRCEIVPNWTDYNNLSKWEFKTDQDEVPDWYSKSDAEQCGRKIAEKIIKERLWKIGGWLSIFGCTGLTKLPDGLSVGGWLSLYGCTGLTELPDGLSVGGSLNLSGCTGLTKLPDGLSVGGWLSLYGCTGLTELPDGLSVGGSLNLSGCNRLLIKKARSKFGDMVII